MKTAPLVCALALAGCAAPALFPRDTQDAASLAAAETAFAAHSVREDMRAAFLAHFADDGVTVRSGWVNSNAFLKDRPAPPIVLDWRPAYVETARSGDFGLSTGPWKLTPKARPQEPGYGQFVSIWKREAGGEWKVAVDLGIAHEQAALWDRPLEAVTVRDGGMPVAGGIGTAEARFARDARIHGTRIAYRRNAADNLRFYRDGFVPLLGREQSLASPALVEEQPVYAIERMETARSGDFGYARGSYAAASAPTVPRGYFLRVWRLEAGEWKIALDVTNPAPGS
jgi:ketosteroid isomerase-like protein